jgi:hypothetical protein
MLAAQPNAHRHQDGQALFSPGKGKQPHPEYRWPQRAPDGHEEMNLRAAWREGDSIGTDSGSTYGRLHEPSGMLLIAEYGFITTVVRVQEAESEATREIVREHKEGLLDA